tara:strand:+ start:1143 stop:1934 length:792 start_codon:yes stop_codon:yes gene_type:complete
MKFLDAHCHLQDSRFGNRLDFDALRDLGIGGWVVNGTREADWADVSRLAEEVPEVMPSFGLHPWHVDNRSSNWLTKLQELLDSHPQAGIGEIGLDRWIENYDTPTQEDVFLAQLELAAQQNRPVSIHCLRAWGRMLELLQAHPLPDRGFLLHSYGGSAEMIDAFVDLGAYFSFSGYFLHPRKAKTREIFKHVPLHRLLIETDAPDQYLPEDLDQFGRNDLKSGKRINDPGNLVTVYESVASLLKLSLRSLADEMETNFTRLFR